MYIDLHVKYPLFLSDFNESWFFGRFSKNTEMSNFMNIRPLGAESLHAGGQTGQKWRSQYSGFAILRRRLKSCRILGPICRSVHLCYFKSPLTFAPFRVPTNTFVKKPVAHDITLIFFILIHVPGIFYYSELYKNSDSVRTTSTHRLYIQPPYRLRKNCNNNHFVLNGTILMF